MTVNGHSEYSCSYHTSVNGQVKITAQTFTWTIRCEHLYQVWNDSFTVSRADCSHTVTVNVVNSAELVNKVWSIMYETQYSFYHHFTPNSKLFYRIISFFFDKQLHIHLHSKNTSQLMTYTTRSKLGSWCNKIFIKLKIKLISAKNEI